MRGDQRKIARPSYCKADYIVFLDHLVLGL